MAGLVAKLVVFLCLAMACCYCQDAEIRLDDSGKFENEPRPDNPAVMDPEALKEMKAEQEFKRTVEQAHDVKKADGNPGNESQEVVPKIDYLYTPRQCSRKAQKGDLVVVHYTGWLAKSGRKFDTTIDVRRRYVPFEFVLGTGYVIKGWEMGLVGMCRGEKRKLFVPSVLGYGRKGLRGIIPPNATLVFEVDLLDLRRATPNYAPMDLFTSLDKDGDKKLSREEVSAYVKYQSKVYKHPNAPKQTREDHERMVDQIFEREDKDGDGHISHSEFSGPKMPHTEL
eukprot:gene11916-13150_t